MTTKTQPRSQAASACSSKAGCSRSARRPSSSPLRPIPSSPASQAATSCAGTPRPVTGGLTHVRLEDGIELVSADEVYGAVGVIVYPWDVSLSRAAIGGSALNHIERAVTSIVPVGNRVRVRVGPLSAELTALSAEQLGLQRGEEVHATFKATATRLVPLG